MSSGLFSGVPMGRMRASQDRSAPGKNLQELCEAIMSKSIRISRESEFPTSSEIHLVKERIKAVLQEKRGSTLYQYRAPNKVHQKCMS